jgi:hypothetical protein
VASVFEDVLSMPIGHYARLRSVLRAAWTSLRGCAGLRGTAIVSVSSLEPWL